VVGAGTTAATVTHAPLVTGVAAPAAAARAAAVVAARAPMVARGVDLTQAAAAREAGQLLRQLTTLLQAHPAAVAADHGNRAAAAQLQAMLGSGAGGGGGGGGGGSHLLPLAHFASSDGSVDGDSDHDSDLVAGARSPLAAMLRGASGGGGGGRAWEETDRASLPPPSQDSGVGCKRRTPDSGMYGPPSCGKRTRRGSEVTNEGDSDVDDAFASTSGSPSPWMMEAMENLTLAPAAAPAAPAAAGVTLDLDDTTPVPVEAVEEAMFFTVGGEPLMSLPALLPGLRGYPLGDAQQDGDEEDEDGDHTSGPNGAV